MKKNIQNKYQRQFLKLKKNPYRNEENVEENKVHTLKLHNLLTRNQDGLQLSLIMNYQKNYQLLIRFLSIDKNSNIVEYKSISLSEEKEILIEMQRGHGYDVKIQWQNQASAHQKFDFVAHVCRGLMNLTELKILHLDLKQRNFIKVKDTFKIIDFDRALFVGFADTYPQFRNYLRGSQLLSLKKQLFQNSKQIIKKELKLYYEDQLQDFNVLQELLQYSFVTDIIANEKKQFLQKKIMASLEKNIDFIHSFQLGKLLQSIFDQKQKLEIQNIRKSIYQSNLSEQKMTPFQVLLDQLLSQNNLRHCTLAMFYSSFTCTKYCPIELQTINFNYWQKSLISNIYKKRALQFWKQVITLKQINDFQRDQKFTKVLNHVRWYSDEFEDTANNNVLRVIKENKTKIQQSQQSLSKKYIISCALNKQTGLSNFLPSQVSQIASSKVSSQNCSNSEDILHLTNKIVQQNRLQRLLTPIQLDQKYEKSINQNMIENYFTFKLLLINYISSQVSSQHLLTPSSYHLIQKDDKIQLYYHHKITTNIFDQLNDKQKIGFIWDKGFQNVVKFIKQLTKAVVDLESHGLFHPEINLSNILSPFSLKGEINQNKFYRLTNLEKCYFLSYDYQLSNKEQVLLNCTKMILFYFLNLGKCIQNNGIFNNLEDFLSEMSEISEHYEKQKFNYIVCSRNLVQTKKTRIFFQKFCSTFHKFHSKQLGQIFKNVFRYYKQRNKKSSCQFKANFLKEQIVFVPRYWLDKFQKCNQIISSLKNNNIQNAIQSKSFYDQFNDIFPTCEVTNHQGEIIHYYFIDQEKKWLLCNQCLNIYKKSSIQLFCVDHNKLIRYSQPDQKIIKYFCKYFYCEECCQALPPNKKVNLIDSTDFQLCKYICMDLDCHENLISEQNRKKNHSHHLTKSFQQFERFYKASNPQNSNLTFENCKQQGNACISHFQKITSNYTQKISGLFKEITRFKLPGVQQCEKLVKMLNPTDENSKVSHIEGDETNFWRVLKIMHYIYQMSKNKQFSIITIQGFVEFCNSRLLELTQQANQKIQNILSQVYQKLESQIFSKNIHRTVQKFTHQKYGEVINNEIKTIIKPYLFCQIPQNYNQIVKELKIDRKELDLNNFFYHRNLQRVQFQRHCKERCQIYSKWIQQISGQSFNLQVQNKSRKLEKYKKKDKKSKSQRQNFIEYQIYSKELKSSINHQKKIIEQLKLNRQNLGYQRSNLMAAQRKNNLLEIQSQAVDQIVKDLKQINNLSQQFKTDKHQSNINKQVLIKSRKKTIIQQLKYNSQIITLQLRAFNTQIMYNLKCFSQSQIEKICDFTNLEQLRFNQVPNPAFINTFDREYSLTIEMLEAIIQNCTKLKKIHLKGGFVELIPCLTYLVEEKNTSDFVFYANSETVISTKEQIKQLNCLLKSIQFSFPCINLRIRANIDAEEKQMIMQIISKVNQLKLQINGPLQTNNFCLEILRYISSRKDLKVTSLMLKKLKMSKHKQLLKEIAKNGEIQRLVLFNCVDYNSEFLQFCQNSLKMLILLGSLEIKVPIQFIASLLRCQHLQSIEFTSITFELTNLTLNGLQKIRSLSFKYCPSISDEFLATLHKKVINSIQYLLIKQCIKIQQNFLKPLKKMKQLKYLDLQNHKIPVESLLNLQTNDIQVLYIRRVPDLNEQLLQRIGEKWQNIIGLALPQYSVVSIQTFKKYFKRLKNLFIFQQQFSNEIKYWLMDNKINVEETN